MLFAFRTDFYQLCPSCFDPVTCGCSLTGLVYACLLLLSKWENLSLSDRAVTFFCLTADWSDIVLVTQMVKSTDPFNPSNKKFSCLLSAPKLITQQTTSVWFHAGI